MSDLQTDIIADNIRKAVNAYSTPKDLVTALLKEAIKVLEERHKSYGDVQSSFANIAELWSAAGFSFRDEAVTAHDVGTAMILMKLSRESNAPDRDNLIDIAGYASCMGALERVDESSEKLSYR